MVRNFYNENPCNKINDRFPIDISSMWKTAIEPQYHVI